MSHSRRERRAYAKQLGVLSRKENFLEMMERFKRSSQAGQYLHTHHLQEIKNAEIEKSDPEVQDSPEEDSINPYGFLGKR